MSKTFVGGRFKDIFATLDVAPKVYFPRKKKNIFAYKKETDLQLVHV